jgi:polyhydroxyalkanoate synthesis repressor PhaR
MPITIKRYPNRKLYNTDTKRYITLDGIAELIRDGESVQVVDHTTNEDLTSLTLSQIIFEQEKKKSGFLPQAVLTGLIQAGGETLHSLRRTMASPLDLFRHVDDEIERRVKDMVSQGELAREEGLGMIDKLIGRGNKATRKDSADIEIERALDRRGVPTRDQIDDIVKQLDALSSKLDEIDEG